MANKWLSSGRYSLTKGFFKRLWKKREVLSDFTFKKVNSTSNVIAANGTIVAGSATSLAIYGNIATNGATVAGSATSLAIYRNIATNGTIVAGSATVPISVSPLSIANGFLSVLRTDTISEAEFPNAALSNGYLDILRNDSITYETVNAPTNLTTIEGDLRIALSWTAPSNASSSLITGYIVEYTPSGGSAQTVSTGSADTSYTITGLTNGTAYTIRVAGLNNGSIGTYTATSNAATPSTANLASVPRNLSASATCCGIGMNVNWSAPTSNGGFAITGYRVQISGGGFAINQVVTGTSLATGSVNGNYDGTTTVSVRAINIAGESPVTSINVSWDFGN